MKKSTTNFFGGLLLPFTIMLVVTSCQKEQNEDFKNDFDDAQGETSLKNSDAKHVSLTCGCTFPDTLQAPPGNKLSLQVYAQGVQIYEVRRSATDPNSFSWVNIAPSATLYQKPDFTHPLGTHYAGPSWEFTKGTYKGKKVVAARVVGVTVDATAIPWLLLKKVDSLSSADIKVTYIQRLCTTGGLAPATGADEAHLGQHKSIPYTASYLFYEAKH